VGQGLEPFGRDDSEWPYAQESVLFLDLEGLVCDSSILYRGSVWRLDDTVHVLSVADLITHLSHVCEVAVPVGDCLGCRETRTDRFALGPRILLLIKIKKRRKKN